MQVATLGWHCGKKLIAIISFNSLCEMSGIIPILQMRKFRVRAINNLIKVLQSGK